MAKQPRASAPPYAALEAARSAARNTDSGSAQPAPPAAGKGDIPAQKAIDTQAPAAAMPANTNKPLEHMQQAPVGLSAKPASRLPTGSTLSESNASDKMGSVAPEGTNAIIGPLVRVRDFGGQRLTTNQRVPVADNQNSLAADGHFMEFVKDQYRHCKTILALGASQALLTEAGLPMSLPDGSDDPGLILADAAHADTAATDFIAAVGMHRHLARDTDPPRV